MLSTNYINDMRKNKLIITVSSCTRFWLIMVMGLAFLSQSEAQISGKYTMRRFFNAPDEFVVSFIPDASATNAFWDPNELPLGGGSEYDQNVAFWVEAGCTDQARSDKITVLVSYVDVRFDQTWTASADLIASRYGCTNNPLNLELVFIGPTATLAAFIGDVTAGVPIDLYRFRINKAGCTNVCLVGETTPLDLCYLANAGPTPPFELTPIGAGLNGYTLNAQPTDPCGACVDGLQCTTETSCSDGIDNDGDGNIDCADNDCDTNAACCDAGNEVPMFNKN